MELWTQRWHCSCHRTGLTRGEGRGVGRPPRVGVASPAENRDGNHRGSCPCDQADPQAPATCPWNGRGWHRIRIEDVAQDGFRVPAGDDPGGGVRSGEHAVEQFRGHGVTSGALVRVLARATKVAASLIVARPRWPRSTLRARESRNRYATGEMPSTPAASSVVIPSHTVNANASWWRSESRRQARPRSTHAVASPSTPGTSTRLTCADPDRQAAPSGLVTAVAQHQIPRRGEQPGPLFSPTGRQLLEATPGNGHRLRGNVLRLLRRNAPSAKSKDIVEGITEQASESCLPRVKRVRLSCPHTLTFPQPRIRVAPIETDPRQHARTGKLNAPWHTSRHERAGPRPPGPTSITLFRAGSPSTALRSRNGHPSVLGALDRAPGCRLLRDSVGGAARSHGRPPPDAPWRDRSTRRLADLTTCGDCLSAGCAVAADLMDG